MYLKKYFVKITILIVAVFLSSCFNKPDEFVSPTWDTELNIPLTAKEFKLLELVEDDSSMLKASNDPSTLGLLYFADTQAVSTIRINDELRISPFQTSFAQTIGPIKINNQIPAVTEVPVEAWANDVTSGEYQVFPVQQGDVNVEVAGIETVESIHADQGRLKLWVWNNLPVDIELRGIKIQNYAEKSIIAELPENSPITVPALDFTSPDTNNYVIVEFNIDGKVVTNSLEYIGKIYSEGSNGDFVQVPNGAGTTMLALFDQLVVGAAIAPLPIQNFNFTKSVVLDDSTKIEEALISQGYAQLIANNNMDVDLRALVTFVNLYDESGNQYKLEIPLSRNEKNKITELPSLTDWVIKAEIPGIPTNQVTYNIEVMTNSTGELSTISKDDSVSFDLVFGELVFDFFNGFLKPTKINIAEKGFKLDYGNLNQQFKFDKVNFKDAAFFLDFISTANLNILFNGEIFATNGIESSRKTVSNITIPSLDPHQTDIAELLNTFTTALPDSFSITGNGLLNPNYEIGSFYRGDSMNGSVNFEIPLNVGIASGIYRDTLDINIENVNDEDIDKINNGELSFSVKSTIPLALTFTATVLDSNLNTVLVLPGASAGQTELEIPAPTMTDLGEVISEAQTIQTLKLTGEEIKTVLKNPFIVLAVNFNTAGADIGPVKFMTENKLSFDLQVNAEYHVDFN